MLDLYISVNDEENGYRFEDQQKETCIDSCPAWLIAIWKRLLELYTDQTTQFITHAQGLDVIEFLDDRNYFRSC